MNIAFVTNFCPHYRVATFQTLAEQMPVQFYFFSRGTESYWLPEHGVSHGKFPHEYVRRERDNSISATLRLSRRLCTGRFDAYVKCINGVLPLLATYAIARLRRKPFILWTGIWKRIDTRKHRLLMPFTLHLLRNADAIVAYGTHVADYLRREGVAPARIAVSRHAVDNITSGRKISASEIENVRNILGASGHDRILLYVGRLAVEKGLDHLLMAVASLPDAFLRLALVGTGELRKDLERQARSLEMGKRIAFVGYVPPADLPAWYATAWAAVLPSVETPTQKEPWGLVVNEAFNQGCPVVVSDCVGAAAGGLVRDGDNGFVVPQRNSEALAKAIQRIMQDEALRNRMGNAGRKLIRQWGNPEMAQGFRTAIERAVNKE